MYGWLEVTQRLNKMKIGFSVKIENRKFVTEEIFAYISNILDYSTFIHSSQYFISTNLRTEITAYFIDTLRLLNHFIISESVKPLSNSSFPCRPTSLQTLFQRRYKLSVA